ncbi:phosphonate metabolism transcriptional regulator PhnF [Rhizobium sp. TRM95796]|uniref:phosphonate metabolism transcriptional regulator PhnF n=1 Tax=Rhizobium sp. TRM95796 TaxID=2979862 RepID=UPI0021E70192|nr:phosphonate metabolism transcriptional regulator PhnF [Rhizobium sp. TRM95796]MCV3766538.1 phosphonate metabolism transcriptional regulator PhnF [Rhizobium sp. TRM95796]
MSGEKSRGPVERRSGVALWRQIADAIRQSIADGEFEGMMPGEIALAARFGVNRHTVRAAIAALVEEGLLDSVQGRGTLIRRQTRFTFPITRRTRFSEGLAGQSSSRDIRLVAEERIEADAMLASALGVELGVELLRLTLVSRADGVPVSTSINHFDAARFAGMAAAVRDTGSITRAYAELGVTDYIRLTTDLTARLADERERLLLELKPGAVVMEARAVNATPDGAPIQYAVTCFAADRVTLKLDMPV